jgi:outer membrane scaffolding protein for murein synthesis (MipA/OmpV family)
MRTRASRDAPDLPRARRATWFVIAACACAWACAGSASANEAVANEAAPRAAAARDAAARPGTSREAPLWELGVGAAALTLPHYRGSEQSRQWLLPLPYFVYRGQFLRADREGARAVLLERRAFEIDMSAAGSAPTRSDGNRARAGMPDLAPTFEFGPNANLTFARGEDWKAELRAPVRAAFTVQRSPRHVGWTATPYLTAEWVQAGWDVGVRLGGLWGDRRFNGYTYEVAPEFATAGRATYRAGSGYAGWQATAGASRRFGSLWIGAFARSDSVGGAVFEPSPLVTRRQTWSAGIAMSWVFANSSVIVKVPD